MAVHKDCYSAIDLTQQDGLHRRETVQLGTLTEQPAWYERNIGDMCPAPETAAPHGMGAALTL